jgi:hypothetical protein
VAKCGGEAGGTSWGGRRFSLRQSVDIGRLAQEERGGRTCVRPVANEKQQQRRDTSCLEPQTNLSFSGSVAARWTHAARRPSRVAQSIFHFSHGHVAHTIMFPQLTIPRISRNDFLLWDFAWVVVSSISSSADSLAAKTSASVVSPLLRVELNRDTCIWAAH